MTLRCLGCCSGVCCGSRRPTDENNSHSENESFQWEVDLGNCCSPFAKSQTPRIIFLFAVVQRKNTGTHCLCMMTGVETGSVEGSWMFGSCGVSRWNVRARNTWSESVAIGPKLERIPERDRPPPAPSQMKGRHSVVTLKKKKKTMSEDKSPWWRRQFIT